MTSKAHPFSVWITPSCLEKLNMYATEAIIQHQSEIGGFARIHEDGQDVFVTDIFIPKQVATGGTFDITAEMDNEFMRHMMKSGMREDLPNWKSLVHSHPVGMSPSMSSVDVEAIQRRAEDSECYSLIISASRSADSVNMFMHYCVKIGGKTLIFNNIPVQIGWDVDRRNLADKHVESIAKDLGATTQSDLTQVMSAIRDAMCTELPPLFEDERKKQRKEIAAEVKEKLSKPFSARNKSQWSGGSQGALWGPQNSSQGRRKGSGVSFPDRADMLKDQQTCNRLYAIAYDKIDPSNPEPNNYVTKEQSKKARKMYRKTICNLNERLRSSAGFGLNDLVVLNDVGIKANPAMIDMLNEPVEIEEFGVMHGTIFYVAGGEQFWPDEIELVGRYEDIMGWNTAQKEVTA